MYSSFVYYWFIDFSSLFSLILVYSIDLFSFIFLSVFNYVFLNLYFIMFSSLSSSLVFSTIEYFSYLNLWLIILFLFVTLFFLLFSSCQLLISSILCSGAVFEFSLIFVCFLFVVIIISPALIILLDSEIIIIPSFIVYSCGYQWAWTFSFYYLNWISNCDHYLYSSYYLVNQLQYIFIYFLSRSHLFIYSFSLLNLFYIHDSLLILAFYILFHYLIPLVYGTCISLYNALIFALSNLTILFLRFIDILINSSIKDLSNTDLSSIHNYDLSSLNTFLFYFFTCNTTILIPILSTIRFFVFSYDVIHSLGIYSFGIKIDAIPGRFNFTSTIRTLIKGAHYGYCYEFCGHGHSSMLIVVKTCIKSAAISIKYWAH